MGRVKDLSKGWDSNFLTELLSDPRKLGEKIRGRRGKGVSNVDFFFFFRWNAKPNFDETWTEISRGDEAWSKLSILKRNVSKVRTDLQRKSRWISVGFLPVFHIPILSLSKILYIYFVSSIHSSCRLDPFKSRSNFFSFINFVSAMREGEEKSCFIRFEDCTKTLHKIRTGRCNFSKEVFEPNLTFCIES